MTECRVRFAPSPTGYLHVGGLRTALYNFLFAARNRGRVVLRIEDTDQSRKVKGAVENLMKSLAWAGLKFDECPEQGGDFGPYIQSKRLGIYSRYAKRLVDQGDAYYCFCSPEELKKMRDAQAAEKLDIGYNGRCRHLNPERVIAKLALRKPHVIRLKVDRTRPSYVVDDLIRGKVNFSPEQIDDQVLIKSDGFPTYHLANVVDDHMMKISHVIRGEEWLPSTPKHLILYEYFGWEPPRFAHLPLLLNQDKSKLSKRQGDVATEDYKNKGFLPEALVNFVALLGWHPADDQEIFSMEQLVENFSLERVGKAGAVFDIDKLRWMNQEYIRAKSPGELLDELKPFLPKETAQANRAELLKMVAVVQDYLTELRDIKESLKIFYNDSPDLTDELLLAVKSENAEKVYAGFIKQLENEEFLNSENFGVLMKKTGKETGVKGKNLWGPMRIALTLAEQGPDLGSVVDILGKDKCLKRLKGIMELG